MITRKLALLSALACSLFIYSCNKEKHYLQTRLDAGESIPDLLEDFPVDSFYSMSYQGGFIIDLDPQGSGIVIGKSDVTSDSPWGCDDAAYTGVDGSAVGTGQSNSDNLANQCTDPYSAIAYTYNSKAEGYNDWYLPSEGELVRAYSRVHLQGKGDFNSLYYWSSTQVDQNTARYVLFTNGTAGTGTKTNLNYIRAARTFTF